MFTLFVEHDQHGRFAAKTFDQLQPVFGVLILCAPRPLSTSRYRLRRVRKN
jgi:hypothetical protein